MTAIVINHDSFTVDKSRVFLYYDKFRYRAKIPVDNVQYFRHVNSMKRLWDQVSYVTNIRSIGLNDKDIFLVKRFVGWLENNTHTKKDDYHYSLRVHHVNFYTNNPEIVGELITALGMPTKHCQLFRAIDVPKTDRTKIYLVDPRHQYRIYLKWGKTSDEQRDDLINFINSYNITCSDSFQYWVRGQLSHHYSHYLWDNYFIEFDDETIITLMSLKFDNLVRKICSIEKR